MVFINPRDRRGIDLHVVDQKQSATSATTSRLPVSPSMNLIRRMNSG